MKKTAEIVKFGIDSTFDTVVFLIFVIFLLIMLAVFVHFGAMLLGMNESHPSVFKWLCIIGFVSGAVIAIVKSNTKQ